MTIAVTIRWVEKSDLPEMLRIESESFEHPWTTDDFMSCFVDRRAVSMVAEHDREIVGFMVFRLHKSWMELVNLVVAPEFRRRSVGSQMMLNLIDKVVRTKREEIGLEIRERNLDGQLFFQHHGFRAFGVKRAAYEQTGEDAYLMRFTLPADVSPIIRSQL